MQYPGAIKAFAKEVCRNDLLNFGRLHFFFPDSRLALDLNTDKTLKVRPRRPRQRARRAARLDGPRRRGGGCRAAHGITMQWLQNLCHFRELVGRCSARPTGDAIHDRTREAPPQLRAPAGQHLAQCRPRSARSYIRCPGTAPGQRRPARAGRRRASTGTSCAT